MCKMVGSGLESLGTGSSIRRSFYIQVTDDTFLNEENGTGIKEKVIFEGEDQTGLEN